MLTISAPGKIHLLGEHVIVYGRPALLAAIDKRLDIRIGNQESLRQSSGQIGIRNNEEVVIETIERNDLVLEAIRVFKKAFSIKKLPPLKITIESQISTGCGLGSSAAVAASTIGALAKFTKNIWDPVRINELTFEVEKKAHGNPSGADNTTIVFGGLVWYRREFDASTSFSMTSAEQFGPEQFDCPELTVEGLTAEGLSRMPNPEPVERVDFLKSIWSFPISDYKMPHFLLLDTGRPKETTKEMVDSVAKLYAKNKNLMEEIFDSQEVQTKRLLLALRSGDKKEIIEAIKTGEYNLEKIGVVGSFAKKIIREIEEIGGVAKICGAGGRKQGSGILLCHHEDLSKIKNVAKKYSLPVFPVKLGEEGIRIENQES